MILANTGQYVQINDEMKPNQRFSLVAFGGAGPMHACSLAKLCGSYPAIVPPSPGGNVSCISLVVVKGLFLL